MQARTVDAVVREAASLGAVACPVFNNGKVDEVHLFRNQQLAASIFVPITGRIGVWRGDADQVCANTPAEAVRRALDPQRKHTRGLRETQQIHRKRHRVIIAQAA